MAVDGHACFWIQTMGLLVLLFLPFRVLSVFTGFTFTDAVDYGPLMVLVLGLAAAVLVTRYRKNSARLVATGMLLLLSVWPLLPNLGILLLAREFRSVRGVWPRAMIDDPKYMLGSVSPRFDSLFHLVNYLDAYSGACMVAFVAVFVAVYRRFSTRQRCMCLIALSAVIVVAMLDPGNLFAWWLD